ncbi:hypothetical protein [Pelagibacterium lentulum]|uniref:Uncharacterized protein n=1 Tax=Pelagibacterium lentulum TaxID=2029865 RepID=A0A916R6J8_9HYPH|nr:hypothetical protein [Pelagibacterium lentulum]GGA41333.1 hypothetical protein GCM10011499_08690 [Pelagibacterium lentulum]
MKLISAIAITATLAFAAPANAQLLGSSSNGLLGLGNNLLSLQTGNISVLDGGVLNGANVLSGIGLNSNASTAYGSTFVYGRGHVVGAGNHTRNVHQNVRKRGW